MRILMRIKKTTTDVDEIAKIYLKTIDILKKYDVLDEIDLPSGSPDKRLLVDQSFEGVKKLLIEGWDKILPSVGTRIRGYFYKENNKNGDFNFNYGVDAENLQSKVIVDLEDKLKEKENKEIVMNLFKELYELHLPDYAVVYSLENKRLYPENKIGDRKLTTTRYISWLNYWNNDIVKSIGLDKIKEADIYEVIQDDRGYFLRIQENYFDETDEVALENQRSLMVRLFGAND